MKIYAKSILAMFLSRDGSNASPRNDFPTAQFLINIHAHHLTRSLISGGHYIIRNSTKYKHLIQDP